MNEFNNIISKIKIGLGHLCITEIETDKDYKKSFYIDELKQKFLIEKIGNEEFDYTYSSEDTFFINKNSEKFIETIIRHIEKRYEVYSYKNLNKYKRFIKKLEAIIGRNIEESYNTLEEILLIEDNILMFSIPLGGTPFYTYKDDLSGNDNVQYYNYKTQKSLFEYLELLYQ